jgi:hypothetical protein
MYQIAKREEREWRMKQAEEIKAMLFRSPQPAKMSHSQKTPAKMREAIKHIHSNLVFWGSDNDDGVDDDLE